MIMGHDRFLFLFPSGRIFSISCSMDDPVQGASLRRTTWKRLRDIPGCTFLGPEYMAWITLGYVCAALRCIHDLMMERAWLQAG